MKITTVEYVEIGDELVLQTSMETVCVCTIIGVSFNPLFLILKSPNGEDIYHVLKEQPLVILDGNF